VAPGIGGLFGKTGNQVEADIANAGVNKSWDGLVNIRAAVHAAGGFQFRIVERLRAKTDAIDTGSEPMASFFWIDGFGIGFQSDFFQGTGETILNRM